MKRTLIALSVLALAACANISGPCKIGPAGTECQEGGSITIVSTGVLDLIKK